VRVGRYLGMLLHCGFWRGSELMREGERERDGRNKTKQNKLDLITVRW